MKQKVLIQVWGKAGSGKSSTIKIVEQDIIKKYIAPGHTYTLPLPKGDIHNKHVFTVVDDDDERIFKVGLCSEGDYLNSRVKAKLDDFFNDCDIIIAASRVYNDVNKYLETNSDSLGFQRIKVTNYCEKGATDAMQLNLNELSAKHIFQLFNELIADRI